MYRPHSEINVFLAPNQQPVVCFRLVFFSRNLEMCQHICWFYLYQSTCVCETIQSPSKFFIILMWVMDDKRRTMSKCLLPQLFFFLFFLIYLYTETGVRTFVSYFDSCISHYQLLQVSCLLKLKALTNPFVLILFNTIFIIVFMAQYFSCMCRGEGGRGGIFAWKWIGILYIFFMETFQATKLASSKQWQGIGFSYWILTSCQPHRVTTQWNQFQKLASG